MTSSTKKSTWEFLLNIQNQIRIITIFLFSTSLYCMPAIVLIDPKLTLNDLDLAVVTERRSPQTVIDQKNYFIPALEIVGFQFLLNQYNRNFASDKESYKTNLSSIRDNFHEGFGLDRDSFRINQIGHPYQGSIYYGIARSAGLNFWESLGYTTVGSAIWEYAGETTRPSTNDQITTSLGGSFLGDVLFRMGETFWGMSKRTKDITPEVGAAITSPPSEFNRQVFGKSLKPEAPRYNPAIYSKLQAGVLRDGNVRDPSDDNKNRISPMVNLEMDYGLPGKSGYSYTRPFDYFNFDGGIVARQNDTVDHLKVRGLLYGTEYKNTKKLSGIWGLYGSYDYLAPEVFRVASTALSFGTTNQLKIAERLAFQSSLLGGMGFGAGGSNKQTEAGGDYHYGAIPQCLLSMKLIIDDRISLDFLGQDLYLTGSSAESNENGDENITQIKTGITLKLKGSHAISFQYVNSERTVLLSDNPNRNSGIETLGLNYTYILGERMGTTD